MLLLALLLAFSTVSADFVCPSGYINTNGFCWRIYSYQYTHDQASQYCKNDRTQLATFTDLAVNTAITNYANRNYETLYIGYKCSSKSTCTGDNGISINTTTYFYGGSATPSVGHCVVLDTNGPFTGKWMSIDCNTTSSFVCGYDLMSVAMSSMKSSKCGVPYNINAPNTFTSMNYPAPYDNNENCAYFLLNGPFTIYFDTFNTESPDIVAIYGNAYRNTGALTFIGSYYGNRGAFNVTVPYGSALVTFTTDGSVTYSGFSARIVR